MHGLAFGVDRLAPAFRILRPIGNETPAQRVERYDTGLMIAPDHQQVLAGGAVPTWRIVVRAAVAHVHAFKNGISQRSAALNHSAAHARYVVLHSIRVHGGCRFIPTRAGDAPSRPRNAAGRLTRCRPGGVFGDVIDHDCNVFSNYLLLRGAILYWPRKSLIW